jgi:catechol 2,3-dioxygenase-like lactoylglutathione lyase family enzyme
MTVKEDCTMKLNRIAIVSIPVKDAQQAKAFYIDKLGFVVKRENPYGDTFWIEVGPETGETTVVLTTWFPNFSPVTGFVIDVDDIDSVYATLQERGVTLTPLESAPWGRYTTLQDPDGNGWVIQQSAR